MGMNCSCDGAAGSACSDGTAAASLLLDDEGEEQHGWEVRLVLELCDRGSLRQLLSAGGLLRGPVCSSSGGGGGGGGGADGGVDPFSAQNISSSRSGGCGSAGSSWLQQCATPALDMRGVIDTALDVARAMVHLHNENILHSDLKARTTSCAKQRHVIASPLILLCSFASHPAVM